MILWLAYDLKYADFAKMDSTYIMMKVTINANYSRYVCPAHCSGREARQYVASRYPNKYCEVKTGTRLNLPLI